MEMDLLELAKAPCSHWLEHILKPVTLQLQPSLTLSAGPRFGNQVRERRNSR